MLDKIVPALMFLMIYLGSRLVLKELIPYLLEQASTDDHRRLITLYKAFFSILVSSTSALYLAVYFNLFHSAAPLRPTHPSIQNILNKSIVYQATDLIGSPLRCSLCQDEIIPVRGRHCLDCDRCIPGFDHHCVWFAQCISLSSTLKPFLQVLVLGIATILTGSLPLYPVLRQHLAMVVRLTWSNHPSGDTLRRIWWDRWWGWAGGPVYRFLFAFSDMWAGSFLAIFTMQK